MSHPIKGMKHKCEVCGKEDFFNIGRWETIEKYRIDGKIRCNACRLQWAGEQKKAQQEQEKLEKAQKEKAIQEDWEKRVEEYRAEVSDVRNVSLSPEEKRYLKRVLMTAFVHDTDSEGDYLRAAAEAIEDEKLNRREYGSVRGEIRLWIEKHSGKTLSAKKLHFLSVLQSAKRKLDEVFEGGSTES